MDYSGDSGNSSSDSAESSDSGNLTDSGDEFLMNIQVIKVVIFIITVLYTFGQIIDALFSSFESLMIYLGEMR